MFKPKGQTIPIFLKVHSLMCGARTQNLSSPICTLNYFVKTTRNWLDTISVFAAVKLLFCGYIQNYIMYFLFCL